MKADLKDYRPANPKYVLADSVKEEFPLELDFKGIPDAGLQTKRDIMKFVGAKFTAVFPENEYVEREMDEFEKKAIREEYFGFVEVLLPQRKRELEQALEEAKRMKKEAEERLNSVLQELETYGAEVRRGISEERLKSSETFCIAIAGYYLTYTWNEATETFVLAKAVPVPDNADLWANDENNRNMMLECFGVEFDEPVRTESEENDNADF